MNKNQRKQLEDIIGKILDLQESIEIIRDEEQEKLDNMPDNLINSERFSQIEEGISCLENAIDNLQTSCDDIQEAIER